jgi:hypothetical protein
MAAREWLLLLRPFAFLVMLFGCAETCADDGSTDEVFNGHLLRRVTPPFDLSCVLRTWRALRTAFAAVLGRNQLSNYEVVRSCFAMAGRSRGWRLSGLRRFNPTSSNVCLPSGRLSRQGSAI